MSLSSKNTMFYTHDTALEALHRVPSWVQFHKQCGVQGLFFDDIEKEGRRGAYSAVSFRLEKRDGFIRYLVARGKGADPIAAVLDTFENSIAAGFPVTPELRNLFDAPAAPDSVDYDDILGGETPIDYEDILG